MAVIRLIGDYGLQVGKKAMKVAGCKKCGNVGAVPLGSVRTVKKFTGILTVYCTGCDTSYVASTFETVEDGPTHFFICYAWKPMPDVDIDEEESYEAKKARMLVSLDRLVNIK